MAEFATGAVVEYFGDESNLRAAVERQFERLREEEPWQVEAFKHCDERTMGEHVSRIGSLIIMGLEGDNDIDYVKDRVGAWWLSSGSADLTRQSESERRRSELTQQQLSAYGSIALQARACAGLETYAPVERIAEVMEKIAAGWDESRPPVSGWGGWAVEQRPWLVTGD